MLESAGLAATQEVTALRTTLMTRGRLDPVIATRVIADVDALGPEFDSLMVYLDNALAGFDTAWDRLEVAPVRPA